RPRDARHASRSRALFAQRPRAPCPHAGSGAGWHSHGFRTSASGPPFRWLAPEIGPLAATMAAILSPASREPKCRLVHLMALLVGSLQAAQEDIPSTTSVQLMMPVYDYRGLRIQPQGRRGKVNTVTCSTSMAQY